jgi:hypothetical protein
MDEAEEQCVGMSGGYERKARRAAVLSPAGSSEEEGKECDVLG